MAKFTILYKNQPIKTDVFEKGIVHIGRDEINNIVIDSPDVAPAHTAIVLRKQGNIIKQLNDDFPLVVNTHKTKGCSIKDGDTIFLGDYSIVFKEHHDNEPELAAQQVNVQEESKKNIEPETKILEGNLQIMEGEHIGRIIPLKKAMTRLGRSDYGGVVIISRRKDGYYISALDEINTLEVNNKPVGNKTVSLKNNDKVMIDNVKMIFFTQ